MSDRDVAQVLDEMERLLREDPFPLDADAIGAWRTRFSSAASSAERGPGWSELVTRAHSLAGRVQAVVEDLEAKRDVLRSEMDVQVQGARALKAYRPAGN